MRQTTDERFSDLLATQSPPCISLFQPTHRQHPANVEDPIRFRNLVRELKQMVNGKYSARLADLVDRFGTAKSRQTGSGDLSDVAKAVVADRVATLLVDSDRSIPGTLDRNTGAIQMTESADSHVDDLLDDLGESVIAKGGEVVIVPSDRMPTESGLAAIFRF